jgi:hypothetical protein
MTHVELSHMEAYTTIITPIAYECRACHAMRHWFINRFGRSCCLDCDAEGVNHAERQ